MSQDPALGLGGGAWGAEGTALGGVSRPVLRTTQAPPSAPARNLRPAGPPGPGQSPKRKRNSKGRGTTHNQERGSRAAPTFSRSHQVSLETV